MQVATSTSGDVLKPPYLSEKKPTNPCLQQHKPSRFQLFYVLPSFNDQSFLCRHQVSKEREMHILAQAPRAVHLDLLASVAQTQAENASAKQPSMQSLPTVIASNGSEPRAASASTAAAAPAMDGLTSRLPPPKPAQKQTLLPIHNKNSLRADKQVARFIIQAGLPFSVARDPAFIQLCRSMSQVPDSYLPPSEDQVKGRMLDELYAETSMTVQTLLKKVEEFGCSIISDGCPDINSNFRKAFTHYLVFCFTLLTLQIRP